MIVRPALRSSLGLLGLATAACLVAGCATGSDADGLTPREPRTLIVAQSGPRDHSTIQRAINAAASGDIVRVGVPPRMPLPALVAAPLPLCAIVAAGDAPGEAATGVPGAPTPAAVAPRAAPRTRPPPRMPARPLPLAVRGLVPPVVDAGTAGDAVVPVAAFAFAAACAFAAASL